VDVDIIAERRELLLIFCVLFIAMLRIWGVKGTSGNRSWLAFSWLPFNIQPAEICKVFFILILAKLMSVKQNKLSSPLTVGQLAGITLLLVGLILYVSDDAGVALNYVFVFIVMAFVGGVNLMWFLAGFGAVAVAAPFVWTHMRTDQQNRILVVFNPSIDPDGLGVRYQTKYSLHALQNGGVAGQGLYHGSMVQSGQVPAQHTDFVFASIGEELGLIGCLAVLLLLTAIILRCVRVGVKSGNYMNRLICIGIASMLAFQILVNVGHVPRHLPRHWPDAPLHQLRRQLDRDDVPRHGHRLGHPHAACPGQQRPVYPAEIQILNCRPVGAGNFFGFRRIFPCK
jgi:rod shape determining protein RodA